MPIHHVTSVEQFDEIISDTSGNQFVLVDFYAVWCGPCKRIAPKLEEFSKTYSNVTFLKVDVEVVTELSDRYKISAMPTFLMFKTGCIEPHYKPLTGADEKRIENLLKMVTTPISTNF